MKIQLNTDKNIQGDVKLTEWVNEVVNSKLNRFSNRITRVELHLSDQNGGKFGGFKSIIEVRIEGKNPVLAQEVSDNLHTAVNSSLDKIKSVIENLK